MAYENNDRKMESVYSKRIRAGKRRTYFFDVRATRGNDYYLTITESRKRFNEDGYDRHKIFLYKEDFNKFIKGLGEAIDYVKTELMPDFDFDAFNHENDGERNEGGEYHPVNNGEGNSEAKDQAKEDEEIHAETSSESTTEPDSTPIIATTPMSTPPANDSQTEEVDKW